jgi:hypothetical protein
MAFHLNGQAGVRNFTWYHRFYVFRLQFKKTHIRNSIPGNSNGKNAEKKWPLHRNADDSVDEFYKEDDLINEDGYEMESILPEATENPTPHFEDETFEILSEEQPVHEPEGIKMELIEKETEEVELEQPVMQPTPKKRKIHTGPRL